MKKGDRVKTFGLSYNRKEWCSDGTAKLINPVDGYDPEPVIFLFEDGDSNIPEEGPFYRWRVRFEDDGTISERWVREADLVV